MNKCKMLKWVAKYTSAYDNIKWATYPSNCYVWEMERSREREIKRTNRGRAAPKIEK